MSVLTQRIEKLKELREDLHKSPDRKITVFSYIQLLDYHINLLEELDQLVNAIKNGDENYVKNWYNKRVI